MGSLETHAGPELPMLSHEDGHVVTPEELLYVVVQPVACPKEVTTEGT